MQEIRILFSPSAENSCIVSLTDGDCNNIGDEVPFEPFLTDDDYNNLRWSCWKPAAVPRWASRWCFVPSPRG